MIRNGSYFLHIYSHHSQLKGTSDLRMYTIQIDCLARAFFMFTCETEHNGAEGGELVLLSKLLEEPVFLG